MAAPHTCTLPVSKELAIAKKDIALHKIQDRMVVMKRSHIYIVNTTKLCVGEMSCFISSYFYYAKLSNLLLGKNRDLCGLEYSLVRNNAHLLQECLLQQRLCFICLELTSKKLIFMNLFISNICSVVFQI